MASMATGTSAARVAANRANALLSTGPRTAEGKARARANAVKHGLTGAGLALPTEDAAVVERRFVELQAELAPDTLEGALLVRQAALMSVRIDRAAQQEAATLALKIRHAEAEFDIEHAHQVDHWFDTIETNPRDHRRRLLGTVAGVDRLLAALESVRDQVESGAYKTWNETCRRKVDAFLGGDYGQFPVSRADAVLAALRGNFLYIPPAEIADRPKKPARIEWARAELIRLVDVERAALIVRKSNLNPEIHAADRREAAARAQFSPDPDAILARKYEAAATRSLYRSLRDFHALAPADAELAHPPEPARAEVAPPAPVAAAPATAPVDAARPLAREATARPSTPTLPHEARPNLPNEPNVGRSVTGSMDRPPANQPYGIPVPYIAGY